MKTAKSNNLQNLPRMDEGRMDGWYSALTGIGTGKYDKRLQSQFVVDPVDDQEAQDLWRGDDMACRIIETIPKEMFREGFDLRLEDIEISSDFKDELSEANFSDAYTLAKEYERAYGGAAIFPSINDSQSDLTQPLNINRIASIDNLLVLEPRELTPVRWYSDATKASYGQPEIWRLIPLSAGGMPAQMMVDIHESRLIIFRGPRVTRGPLAGVRLGWGDSVLTRIRGVLRDFNMSWASSAVLLNDFAQAVFKMKNLAEMIAFNRDDVIKMRMNAVELGRSTARAILIDADQEEFERKQTPLSGLPEMMDKFSSRLAAAAEMPLTMLMGISPGGLNATGESDITLFYNSVSRHQLRIEPQVKKGIDLFMRNRGGILRGNRPKKYSFKWRPLTRPSNQEDTTSRKTQADIDKIYIDAGVVSAEEVAISRFGGNEYSFETHVDFEARARLEPAADPPAKTEQQLEDEKKAEELKLSPPKEPEGDTAGRMDFIERRGGKYVVLSEDKQKILGEYETENEALYRLAQVEYFKSVHRGDKCKRTDFNPAQPRDKQGRWGRGGFSASSQAPSGAQERSREEILAGKRERQAARRAKRKKELEEAKKPIRPVEGPHPELAKVRPRSQGRKYDPDNPHPDDFHEAHRLSDLKPEQMERYIFHLLDRGNLPGDAQQKFRNMLSNELADHGLRENRDTINNNRRPLIFTDSLGSFVAGQHGWNGIIRLSDQPHFKESFAQGLRELVRGRNSPQLNSAYVEFGANGLRTIFHEGIHGHSPVTPMSYMRTGQHTEEVATELLARRMVSQKLGIKVQHGSYQEWISHYVSSLSRVSGMSEGDSHNELTNAALRFFNTPGQSANSYEHTSNFITHISGLSGEQRERLYTEFAKLGE